MKKKHRKKTSASVANDATPLSSMRESTVIFKHTFYEGVRISLDLHADDHAHVVFEFENGFQGKSPAEIEGIARTQVHIGELQEVIRQDRLNDGSAALMLAVVFEGRTFGDITSLISDYLQDLAVKAGGQPLPPAATSVGLVS